MTLNKREQTIAWSVGAVVGLFVLYQLVNSVFLGTLNSYNDQLYKDQKKGAADKATLDQAALLRPKWDSLGILSDPATMGQQVHTLVTNFAGQTQVKISNWTAQTVTRPVLKTDYQEATYKMQAKGNSGGFFRFLLSLENSHTPMRVDSIEIVGQPPGQDDLAVNLTITALIYAPKLPKGAATQPIVRSTSTRTAATNPAAAKAQEDAIIKKLELQRAAQKQQLATMPAAAPGAPGTPAATGPARSDEEILKELEQKHNAEQAQLNSTTAPAATAPATAPGGAQ